MMLTAFFPTTFWIALIVATVALLLVAWIKPLRWWPALLLRLGLVGLALAAGLPSAHPSTASAPAARELLILDLSDSIAPDERGLARARALEWLRGSGNRIVLVAGSEVIPAAGGALPEVHGEESRLAEAMQLGVEMLGAGGGRILLASDGLASDPLAFSLALEEAQSFGHLVGLIPLSPARFSGDVYVDPPYLPAALWEHTPFSSVLPVTLQQPGEIRLLVWVNEMVVVDEPMTLPAGRHLIPIDLQTSTSEILTLAFRVEVEGDPRPENNATFAALRVYPAPRLLLVTEDASTGGAFSTTLAGEGLDTDIYAPQDLPDSLKELSTYQVILIDNVLASAFSEAQMRSLKDFVQRLGGGLIFTGGRNAFTLGGYKNTLLEPLFPVRLDPPPREQRTPLTLVLVLDRSASMDGPRGTPSHLRPIALAREAALRAIETLSPEDHIGILSYNANSVWTLPIQSAGDGDLLLNAKVALADLSPSGGTAIFQALNAAVTALLDSATTGTRHIVLLSDGNDETSLQEYASLAELARSQDITISTIALGVEADQELMALLAEEGDGRYYPVLQAADLPKILIDESQAARDENVHEGSTRAVMGEPDHPILSGIDLSTMPDLLGYNALESKRADGSEDVLIAAEFEDPLLAVWQFGLGRTAAWTPDTGRLWATAWQDWDGWGRMWANVIRYTLPDPTLGSGQARVAVNGRQVQVEVQVQTSAGIPRNGVPVSFSMAISDGQIRSYPMLQTAPGRYSLSFPRPEEGVYRAVVQYDDIDGFPVELAAPVVVNPPPEWRPETSPQSFPGVNQTSWEDINSETGEQGTPAITQQGSGRFWLVLAALLFWPLEIAVRRRYLPWT